jgi:hypothetical protein
MTRSARPHSKLLRLARLRPATARQAELRSGGDGSWRVSCSFLNCTVNMNRRTFDAQRPTLNIQLSASLSVECWNWGSWEASMSTRTRFGSMNRAHIPSPCPLPSPVHRAGRIRLGRGMKGEGIVFEAHGRPLVPCATAQRWCRLHQCGVGGEAGAVAAAAAGPGETGL